MRTLLTLVLLSSAMLGRPVIPPCDAGWTVVYIPEFGEPLLVTAQHATILDQSIVGRVCVQPENDRACFTVFVHQVGISTTIAHHDDCGASLPLVVAP
jgi:hypothetical protein